MSYPRMVRVRRCPHVERGLQCTGADPYALDPRPIGGGFYDRPHQHHYDPDNAGYTDWRRRFAKVRIPKR